METQNLSNLPERVGRARWNVQHAAYQYFFEVRILLVASGLESLLHTSNKDTGGQFKQRTKQLAERLGILFSAEDAEFLWHHRCDVAHGRDLWAPTLKATSVVRLDPEMSRSNEVLRRYLSAELLIKQTVLRCMKDSEFAGIFFDDKTVEQAFPLVGGGHPPRPLGDQS